LNLFHLLKLTSPRINRIKLNKNIITVIIIYFIDVIFIVWSDDCHKISIYNYYYNMCTSSCGRYYYNKIKIIVNILFIGSNVSFYWENVFRFQTFNNIIIFISLMRIFVTAIMTIYSILHYESWFLFQYAFIGH